MTLRTFEFHRDADVTGYSGTGVVADGVTFDDGTTVVRWRGERRSTVTWASVEDAVAVHGHDGKTRLVWTDQCAACSPSFEDRHTLAPRVRCRSCRGWVAWRVSATGARMPIDPVPTEAGNVVIDGTTAAVLSADALAALDVWTPRYTSHFATCPDADTWRSKGADRG